MASHETLLSKILKTTPDDTDHHHVYDDDHNHDHDHDHEPEHHPIHSHPHNLSRLSVCSSTFMSTNDEDDRDGRDVHDVDPDDGNAHDEFVDDCSHDEWNDAYANGIRTFMSRLSIESFDGDADEEFSDENDGEDLAEMSADSDDEQECYSLPATPPWGRRTGTEAATVAAKGMELCVKEYASENEAQKGVFGKRNRKNPRRRIIRERAGGNGNRKSFGGQSGNNNNNNSLWSNCNSFSGESEGSGGCGLVPAVITRPKGGKRSLCMDLEEVKACRDLGFELEHERMVEIPTRKSVDTSSGGDSPIANWRISSPGDDPRDVKARLKVWAQAVALASSSTLSNN